MYYVVGTAMLDNTRRKLGRTTVSPREKIASHAANVINLHLCMHRSLLEPSLPHSLHLFLRSSQYPRTPIQYTPSAVHIASRIKAMYYGTTTGRFALFLG